MSPSEVSNKADMTGDLPKRECEWPQEDRHQDTFIMDDSMLRPYARLLYVAKYDLGVHSPTVRLLTKLHPLSSCQAVREFRAESVEHSRLELEHYGPSLDKPYYLWQGKSSTSRLPITNARTVVSRCYLHTEKIQQVGARALARACLLHVSQDVMSIH